MNFILNFINNTPTIIQLFFVSLIVLTLVLLFETLKFRAFESSKQSQKKEEIKE